MTEEEKSRQVMAYEENMRELHQQALEIMEANCDVLTPEVAQALTTICSMQTLEIPHHPYLAWLCYLHETGAERLRIFVETALRMASQDIATFVKANPNSPKIFALEPLLASRLEWDMGL
ncbi:hypothetical protein ACTUVN_002361 [Pseudomonas caspiana]